MSSDFSFLEVLTRGIPLDPLPAKLLERDATVPHAPVRKVPLSDEEKVLAVSNALRYFSPSLHGILRPEFEEELRDYGHIYMYRFLPKFPVRAYPITAYPAKTQEGRAIMLMVCNNLDPKVAQFPQELVTYGGNGQVLSNWAQVNYSFVHSFLNSMNYHLEKKSYSIIKNISSFGS